MGVGGAGGRLLLPTGRRDRVGLQQSSVQGEESGGRGVCGEGDRAAQALLLGTVDAGERNPDLEGTGAP
ncbi:unnamed protein product [Sphagnum balticum]